MLFLVDKKDVFALYKFGIVFSLSIFVTACAIDTGFSRLKSTHGLEEVKFLNHDPKRPCRYLGEAYGFMLIKSRKIGFDPFNVKKNTMHNFNVSLQNLVIKKGGNTAVLLKQQQGPRRSILTYSIYNCS